MEATPIGAKFYSETSSSVWVIIKPIDNVGGIVIRTLSNGANGILVTGTVAPKDSVDYIRKPVLMVGTPGTSTQLAYPITLPAGFGLWSVTPNGTNFTALTYDLL